LADHPGAKLQAYNRGISGHKVPDLNKRWQADCIDLKPSILSILVGVNDIWHKLNGNYDGTVNSYETGLHALLQKTRDALPHTKIVVCEPFALRCGAVNDRWFPEFDERRAACKRVSDSMKCTWVPFQTMFDEATNDEVPPSYWAGDGVHPSMAGHALMAKTWLATVL
jgi:lysophospholipase L1-like esterase